MRLTFFNDTGRELHIHAASVCPTPVLVAVKPATTAVFELPDDAEPFVKVWPNAVMVMDMKARDSSPSRR